MRPLRLFFVAFALAPALGVACADDIPDYPSFEEQANATASGQEMTVTGEGTGTPGNGVAGTSVAGNGGSTPGSGGIGGAAVTATSISSSQGVTNGASIASVSSTNTVTNGASAASATSTNTVTNGASAAGSSGGI